MGREAARRLATLAAVGLACAACAGATLAWRHRHHVDMPATLQALARAEGAWDTPWDQQAAKIASLEAEAAHASDAGARATLERAIAVQEVDGGHPDAAAARLEALLERWRGKLRPADELMLQADLAFAYYRVGEQANCGPGIDTATCIVPIDPASIHHARLGAAEAARRYQALAEDPRPPADAQLFFRWMLTLCDMQLGTWPDGVPAPLRLDAAAFRSDAAFPRWTDVAAARGLREFGRAGGLILEDFDNDDHLDILVSHMGMTDPLHYWHNRGDGTFERQDERAGLGGLTGGLNMVQADYDNDGCIDVYIPRGAWQHDKGRIPGSLLHNDCDGTFTDVTGEAGVMNPYPSQVAVWADFDGDGLLDLFIGNEIVRSSVKWPADTPNVRLFINQGDGTFVDRAREAGLRVDGMIKGAAADDYDNDGRPDLYVSVMGGPNHLFHNLGGHPPRFEDVTARAGVGAPAMSFATWFFDFDNDGWPDLYVSGYSAHATDIVRDLQGDAAGAAAETPRLYRNHRDGTFTDVTAALHLARPMLAMGANFGDLDNDGWLDFYLGTGAAPMDQVVPNRMFRNVDGVDFQEVTMAGGFGHLQKGHAVAFGAIDNDGQQDLVEEMGGANAGDGAWTTIYKNPGQAKNRWLRLDLVGVRANRFGVGARVAVTVREADGRTRTIWRTVGSGGSFGASSLRLHVGLGDAASVQAIDVRWPGSGTRQHLVGPLPMNTRYLIQEDAATAVERPLPVARGASVAITSR